MKSNSRQSGKKMGLLHDGYASSRGSKGQLHNVLRGKTPIQPAHHRQEPASVHDQLHSSVPLSRTGQSLSPSISHAFRYSDDRKGRKDAKQRRNIRAESRDGCGGQGETLCLPACCGLPWATLGWHCLSRSEPSARIGFLSMPTRVTTAKAGSITGQRPRAALRTETPTCQMTTETFCSFSRQAS